MSEPTAPDPWIPTDELLDVLIDMLLRGERAAGDHAPPAESPAGADRASPRKEAGISDAPDA
jgi:hypothetical protein